MHISSTNQKGSTFPSSAKMAKAAFNPTPPAVPFKVLSRENPSPLNENNEAIDCLDQSKSEYRKEGA